MEEYGSYQPRLGQEARRHPLSPSLWVSVPLLSGSPWEQGQETHAEVHRPAWVGPQPPLSASLGEGGPPLHSLDDGTLLALEGGAGGWPGQQQLLLVNQTVQQVFLAVVVINLQESQGGDRQPGQPRGPQSKLHRK